jgi:hypothetical protein
MANWNSPEHVMRRDISFCNSERYLLFADAEDKSCKSSATSSGSKRSIYFSQVFKMQSEQFLNCVAKKLIEVTGIEMSLSAEIMHCRASSKRRRYVASTLSYIVGKYPTLATNS